MRGGKLSREDQNRLTRLLVEQRAGRETFRGGRLVFEPADYSVDVEKPRYIVRAIYGPVKGLSASTVVVYNYDPELLKLRHESFAQPVFFSNDSIGGWGPREFLFQVFAAVARFHGDCIILLTHNGVEMQVNAEQFEAWVRSANSNPVAALLETRALLEMK